MNKKIVIGLAIIAAFMMLAVPVAVLLQSEDVSADAGVMGPLEFKGAFPLDEQPSPGEETGISATNEGLGNQISVIYNASSKTYVVTGTLNKQNVAYDAGWQNTPTNSQKVFYSWYPGYAAAESYWGLVFTSAEEFTCETSTGTYTESTNEILLYPTEAGITGDASIRTVKIGTVDYFVDIGGLTLSGDTLTAADGYVTLTDSAGLTTYEYTSANAITVYADAATYQSKNGTPSSLKAALGTNNQESAAYEGQVWEFKAANYNVAFNHLTNAVWNVGDGLTNNIASPLVIVKDLTLIGAVDSSGKAATTLYSDFSNWSATGSYMNLTGAAPLYTANELINTYGGSEISVSIANMNTMPMVYLYLKYTTGHEEIPEFNTWIEEQKASQGEADYWYTPNCNWYVGTNLTMTNVNAIPNTLGKMLVTQYGGKDTHCYMMEDAGNSQIVSGTGLTVKYTDVTSKGGFSFTKTSGHNVTLDNVTVDYGGSEIGDQRLMKIKAAATASLVVEDVVFNVNEATKWAHNSPGKLLEFIFDTGEIGAYRESDVDMIVNINTDATLTKNITIPEGVVINIAQGCTLDTGAFTLVNYGTINNNGTITISEDGKIVSTSDIKGVSFEAKIGSTYYSSFTDALAAAVANDTIELLADCSYTADNYADFAAVALTVNGNSKTLTMNATRVDFVANATFNNVKIVANTHDNLFDIRSNDALTIAFNGCEFSGDSDLGMGKLNFIQAGGMQGEPKFSGTLTVNNCTFDNSGTNLNRDIRAVLTGDGIVSVNNCTFSSVEVDDGTPVKITEANFTDCTMTGNKLSNGNQLYSVISGTALVLTADAPVAQIGDVGYATLADALAAAIADNTVELIANVTIDAELTIPANVTLSVEEDVTLTITDTLTAIGDFTVGGSAIVSSTLALTSATGDELTTFADGFIVFDKDATFTIGGGVVIGEKITITANSTLTLATDKDGNYQWALAGIANVPDGETIELDEGGLLVVTDKSTLNVVGTADFVNGSVEVCGTIDVSGTLKVSIDKLDNENGVLEFQAGSSLVNGEATIIGNDAGAYVKTDDKTKVTISGTIGILQNELFVSTMAIDAKEGASAVTIKDMAADSLFIGIVSLGNNTVDVTMAGDVGADALIISEGSSLTTGENDLTVYELLTVNGTLDSLDDVTLEDKAFIIVGDEGTVKTDTGPYVGAGSPIEIPSGEVVSLVPNELGGYLIAVNKAEYTGGNVVAEDTIVVAKELKVKGIMALSGTILVSDEAVLNMTSAGSIQLDETATPIVQVLNGGALDIKFEYYEDENTATVTFEGVKAGPEGIKICIGSLSISGTYSDNGTGKITFTGDSGKISGNVETGVSIIVGTPGGAAATVTVVEGITFEGGSTVNLTGTSQMVAAEGTVATIVYEAGTTVVQNGTTRVVEVDEQYEVDPQGHLREFIYVFFTGVNCTISVDYIRAYQGDNLADVINSKGVFAIADKPAISIWDGWYTQAGMKLTENTVVPSASTTVTAVYELDMSGYTGHDDDMPVPEKTTTDNGIDVNLLFIIAVVVLLVAIAGLILIIIRK